MPALSARAHIDPPSSSDATSESDSDSAWTDDDASDDDSNEFAGHPSKAGDHTEHPSMAGDHTQETLEGLKQGQLFVNPKVQTAIHSMLSDLQQWWQECEVLLELMSRKKLNCGTLRQMSDHLDKTLDVAIETLITTPNADPDVFPMDGVLGISKEIKKYLFSKIGEVCCQAGKQDKCALLAKTALKALKKFKTSAGMFYDQMISHVLESMQNEAVGTDADLQKFLQDMEEPAPTAPVNTSSKKKKSPKK